jgi:hypothetical protein
MKKLLYTQQKVKVFWYFFSKKNACLPNLAFPVQRG